MTGWIVGLFCGVLLTVACAGVLFVLAAGRQNAPFEPPAPASQRPAPRPEPDLMTACRQGAELANFWSYDGTPQTDAGELAQQMYDKAVSKRG